MGLMELLERFVLSQEKMAACHMSKATSQERMAAAQERIAAAHERMSAVQVYGIPQVKGERSQLVEDTPLPSVDPQPEETEAKAKRGRKPKKEAPVEEVVEEAVEDTPPAPEPADTMTAETAPEAIGSAVDELEPPVIHITLAEIQKAAQDYCTWRVGVHGGLNTPGAADKAAEDTRALIRTVTRGTAEFTKNIAPFDYPAFLAACAEREVVEL